MHSSIISRTSTPAFPHPLQHSTHPSHPTDRPRTTATWRQDASRKGPHTCPLESRRKQGRGRSARTRTGRPPSKKPGKKQKAQLLFRRRKGYACSFTHRVQETASRTPPRLHRHRKLMKEREERNKRREMSGHHERRELGRCERSYAGYEEERGLYDEGVWLCKEVGYRRLVKDDVMHGTALESF